MLVTTLAILSTLLSGAIDPAWRRPVISLMMASAAGWLALLAREVGRQPNGRGAELITVSYAFFALTYLLRLAVGLLGYSRGSHLAPTLAPTLDLVLVMTGGLVAGIFGNVGYVGLALYLFLLSALWIKAAAIIRAAKDRVELAWAANLARMMQVTFIGFAVGGAFLTLVNFDVPYYLVAIMVVTLSLVERESNPVHSRNYQPSMVATSLGNGGSPRS